MTDYISREAAKKEIVEFWEVMPELRHCKENQLKRINSVPAADVRPVVRGEWIDVDVETYTWKIRCSECGYERSMLSTQGNYPHYCENCGAQMNGGDAK